MEKINNKKGFTLIELLAVIVIMGVLMIVAIPAMTRYIENSKKDVFADTAKKYISAARYSLLSDGYYCSWSGYHGLSCSLSDLVPNRGNKIIIKANSILLENDTGKSPWGKNFDTEKSFIVVTNASSDEKSPQYEYSFVGCDDSGNGIRTLTKESEINRSAISRNNTSCATVEWSASDTTSYLVNGIR